MNTYQFFADEGHGWMRVPIKEILDLGIGAHISNFSFMDDDYVYLEEDCDAGFFIKTKEKLDEKVDLDFIEVSDFKNNYLRKVEGEPYYFSKLRSGYNG